MIERLSSQEAEAQEAHLRLLRLIEQHPEFSQRQLALALGISLGKTHYLLKALFDKGWVKAEKFAKSPNKWAYLYRVTPAGITHRLRLARHFLRRKEGEFLLLKAEIDDLREVLSGLPPESSFSNTQH